MIDRLDFEARLEERLQARAAIALRSFDAGAIAHRAATVGGRSRLGWPMDVGRGWPFLVLLGLLVLALAAAVVAAGSRLLVPSQVSPFPRPYEGVFVPAPDLPTPIGRPDIVGLQDGRVLILGGSDGLAPPKVFDPTTGAFADTGPMPTDSPDFYAAQVLRDGRVFLLTTTRSLDATDVGVAVILDPKTLQFSVVGPMVRPRVSAGLAMLGDGRLLVTGGTSDDGNTLLASAEIFDPGTGAFTATGSMHTPRAGPATASLQDGRVLVFGVYLDGSGGTSADGASLSSAELYDPRTGSFSDAGPSLIEPIGNTGRSLVIDLPDGRVLAVAADVAEIFDPTTGSFSLVPTPPDMPYGVALNTAVLLDDGRVLLTGYGWAGIYDVQTGRTREIQPPHAVDAPATRLPTAGCSLSAALTSDPPTDHQAMATPAPRSRRWRSSSDLGGPDPSYVGSNAVVLVDAGGGVRLDHFAWGVTPTAGS